MILSERTYIHQSNKGFKELDILSHLSKNLYNAALYTIRQYFFKTSKYLNTYFLDKQFKTEHNVDYYSLPAKVSQQVLKQADSNFKSFFKLIKLQKTRNCPSKIKIPGYLDKNNRNILTYTSQAISRVELHKGFIHPSGMKCCFKTEVKNPRQVRFIPKGNYFIMEVLYKTEDTEMKEDNGRYASIDIGVNNLAALTSNISTPLIINGRPLKSINHFYNKKRAELCSRQEVKLNSNTDEKENIHVRQTKRMQRLSLKRDCRINDYLHKASHYIVNQLVSENVNTLVIGYNKLWKQNTRMGRMNNQNFVQIPFQKFIRMLEYKCRLNGINVVKTEESYTSKCSFLDNEEINKHEEYKGKRIRRGLFRSSDGTLINADINGSLNILKKAVGKFDYDPIKVCTTPLVITP